MASSLDQAQLEALIARSGMNDRELGECLGVAQSTAWRLRNGQISKVEAYVRVLRERLGGAEEETDDDFRLVSDLVALSGRIPALRRALQALREIMHNSA